MKSGEKQRNDTDDKPCRGRPPRTRLEKAKAAFWAWGVQMAAGKDFAHIERELSLKTFRQREDGGYDQPHAWSKYSRGARKPEPPEKGIESPVIRAERKYPGSALAYTSITWDLLYPSQNPLVKPLPLARRLSPYVLERISPEHIVTRDRNRILLSNEGVRRTVLIKHIDALGLLLMQWRNGDRKRLSVEHILYTRVWLSQAFESMSRFAKCKELLVSLIEENVPELGVLEGPGGLDLSKPLEERYRDAIFAGFLVGIPLEGGFQL